MEGEGRVRDCYACEKKVYDLSGMTGDAILELLDREGEAPCVRMHRRRDGTLITADCLVGRRRRNHQGLALAWLTTMSATLFGLASSAVWDEEPVPQPLDIHDHEVGTIIMGEPLPSEPLDSTFDEETFLYGYEGRPED